MYFLVCVHYTYHRAAATGSSVRDSTVAFNPGGSKTPSDDSGTAFIRSTRLSSASRTTKS